MSHFIILLALVYVLGAALVFTRMPALGVALSVLPVLGMIIWQSVEFGLLAAIFCVPFERLFIIAPSMGLTVTKVLIVVTLGVHAARIIVTRDASPIPTGLGRATCVLLLAYLLMSVVSLVNARDLDVARYVLTKRISLALLFFLIVDIVRTWRLLNRAVDLLILASVFVCLLGLYEFATGKPVLSETRGGTELVVTFEGSTRVQGCAGHSNFHAAILAMLLPFVLTRFVQARAWRWRLPLAMLILMYVVNILATNARGGVLGMGLGFVAVFLLNDIRGKLPKLAAGGACVALLTLALSLMPERFSLERVSGSSGLKSVEYRLGWIRMSWEMVTQHPLLGVGTGNYYTEYQRYRRAASTMADVTPVVNHNGIMQVWAENGTLGLAVFLMLLASVPLTLWPVIGKRSVEADARSLAIGIAVAFVVYVLLIGIIPVLEHEVGWIILALAVALRNIAAGRATQRVGSADEGSFREAA